MEYTIRTTGCPRRTLIRFSWNKGVSLVDIFVVLSLMMIAGSDHAAVAAGKTPPSRPRRSIPLPTSVLTVDCTISSAPRELEWRYSQLQGFAGESLLCYVQHRYFQMV